MLNTNLVGRLCYCYSLTITPTLEELLNKKIVELDLLVKETGKIPTDLQRENLSKFHAEVLEGIRIKYSKNYLCEIVTVNNDEYTISELNTGKLHKVTHSDIILKNDRN